MYSFTEAFSFSKRLFRHDSCAVYARFQPLMPSKVGENPSVVLLREVFGYHGCSENENLLSRYLDVPKSCTSDMYFA